jgi:membrane dipeptidase
LSFHQEEEIAMLHKTTSHADELHRASIIIDTHSDILIPISRGFVRLGTEVPVPGPTTWEPPFNIPDNTTEDEEMLHPSLKNSGIWPYTNRFGCMGQYSLPQWLRGGVTAAVCAVFIHNFDLEQALRRALDMVWWFHREVEANERFDMVTSVNDIRRMKAEGKCGGILALEGTECLGQDLKMLDLFYKLGVRMVGLAHNRRNYFCDGTQNYIKTGGLTQLGKAAIKRMNKLGIVVDVGHLNTVGFWEALECSADPVVLSHRSPRKFFPLKPEDSPLHPAYNVSGGRERLQAFAKNGGVFGVFFLWCKDVDDIVADIEYIFEQIGPDHVGIGSDLYGLEDAPKDVEDISKIHAITRKLVERGHSDEVIMKFLGGNFMRVFDQVWSTKAPVD